MDKPEELVTDQQIEEAWGNARFGPYWENHKRVFLNNTILQYACQYESGSTAMYVLKYLKLITEKGKFTQKGRNYLLACFYQHEGVTN